MIVSNSYTIGGVSRNVVDLRVRPNRSAARETIDFGFRTYTSVDSEGNQQIGIMPGFITVDPIGSIAFGGANVQASVGSDQLLVYKVPRSLGEGSSFEWWPNPYYIGYDEGYFVIPICTITCALDANNLKRITIDLQHQLGNVFIGTQI